MKCAQAERRRGDRHLDPERIQSSAEPDPGVVAEAEELARHVHDAATGLPTPYRQALILHLVHGLSAREIARALERPFRTVQSQLRRGLEMVRKALPKSLALPAAALLQPSALAQVRAVIVEQAAVTNVGLGAGIGATGVLVLMKKLVLLFVVASAAVLVGYLWVGQAPSATEPELPMQESAVGSMIGAINEARPTVGLRQGDDEDRSVLRVAETDRERVAHEPRGESTSLLVRVVKKETGDPIPGFSVTLHPKGLSVLGYEPREGGVDGT